ncbi:ABC transporter ATP-binding protein [Desulfosarcina ovata subsp. sediminis]|uniref:Nickel import system ATP-binding protein NikD n=1 Tax=Desulfosarcina ovata subsp. sediminis TaxID=885957 RepID=A0A5K7ZRK5_9BACT|nr:ABC transporter ATP-binding protein [Desulfosarcina ovata]BBO81943.1 ABC transporter ATP-binding protein [Desulfosarcina ovata subsp. sediminis]
MALLEIQRLNVRLATRAGMVAASSDVNLRIRHDERLGLIGETGCGKSILGHALVGLLPENAVATGKIIYDGKNLLAQPETALQNIRGRHIAMIFQDPHSSFNPVLTVYEQLMEIYRYRLKVPRQAIRAMTVRLLERVGIDAERLDDYPHQFSGGMLQRVMIAMAIAFQPRLLVADEITKGLDRPVKWKIVNLIREVTARRSMLLITHDLQVARALCDRIAVMYAGEIVEIDRTERIFHGPAHPYTQGLIGALPAAGLHPIAGQPPGLTRLPAGCRFHPRCKVRERACSQRHPQLRPLGEDRYVRCI